MGKLVYYDGALAVCDFKVGESGPEKAIRLLLGVDLEAQDLKDQLKPLLECWGIPDKVSPLLLTAFEQAEIAERADLGKLHALGVDVAGLHDEVITIKHPVMGEVSYCPMQITPALFFVNDETTVRLVASVAQSAKRIRKLAYYVQYLAKLHLLANGDERFSETLPDIDTKAFYLEFRATVPGMFLDSRIDGNIGDCIRFVNGSVEYDGESERGEITARIQYTSILRDPYGADGMSPLPESGFELKRVVASFLLASILNHGSALPFSVDLETLALQHGKRNTVVNALADSMIAGKIDACPWCGRPVYMPRRNSKIFCRQSHQTRYSEKARAMLDGGASVDDVAAAFPHIQPGTISGWLPIGGR